MNNTCKCHIFFVPLHPILTLNAHNVLFTSPISNYFSALSGH